MQPHGTIGRMLASFCLALAVGACGSFVEDTYFHDQMDKATSDMVGKRYGRAHKIEVAPDGSQTWIYYERREYGYPASPSSSGYRCREHEFTFDQEGILRHSEGQTQQALAVGAHEGTVARRAVNGLSISELCLTIPKRLFALTRPIFLPLVVQLARHSSAA